MVRSVPASHRIRSRARLLITGLFGLGALATGATLLVLGLAIETQARNDERAPADAILVLGAAQYNGRPTRAFRARLDHAAALYRQGYARTLVLVGGTAAPSEPSEAEVGARYLEQLGIPADALLVVPEGRNTWQSLQAAARPLRAIGARRVLLVSDGFHLFRSKLMANDLGFQALGSPAPNSPIRQGSLLERWYMIREAVATLAYLIGRR
ncbi:YdcF family protein [Thermomicrobium sp. CFH 73360]|uniref:YdcF family protein n=1 Tax=Thermomicrobium sp. CFH 73360 TaxID=2951987 RepID=UPI002076A8C5|nr:YdcF family protein [Thermomicrobium sp. CFH 73360]MCM8745118.1 YdcF family protein [Thermomicrobium sp. CFH 73360]